MTLWIGTVGAAVGIGLCWLLAHAEYASNGVFGRPLLFPVLALLAGMIAWTRALPGTPRAARPLGWLAVVGVAVIAVGIIADAWIGARYSVTVWRMGFALELLGALLSLLSTTGLGVALLRARAADAWVPAVLISVIPVSFALAFVMEGYVPSFPVAGLCVAWGWALGWRAAHAGEDERFA